MWSQKMAQGSAVSIAIELCRIVSPNSVAQPPCILNSSAVKPTRRNARWRFGSEWTGDREKGTQEQAEERIAPMKTAEGLRQRWKVSVDLVNANYSFPEHLCRTSPHERPIPPEDLYRLLIVVCLLVK